MSASIGALFGPCAPRQGVQRKAKSGRSSLRVNHVGVLRGFVSAYSQMTSRGLRSGFACRAILANAGCSHCGYSSPVGRRTAADQASPARHDKLAFAICCSADDRRELIVEDTREQRQIA
jgi:hypothetical protein